MIRFDLASAPNIKNGSPAFFPSTGIISIPNDPVATSNISTFTDRQLTHEIVHLLQMFSTNFGRFVSSGLNLRSGIIIETAKALLHNRGKLFIDLRAWRDDLDDTRSNESILLNRLIYGSDRLERSLGHFMGQPTIWAPPWSYDHTQGMSLLGSPFPSVAPPENGILPTIRFRSLDFTISGTSLMESFAVFWTHLFRQGVIETRKIDLSDLILWISSHWGNKELFEIYCLPIAICYESLGIDGLRWFPVIVDLALNGITPSWEEVWQKEAVALRVDDAGECSAESFWSTHNHKWEDVHPGWRFLKIMRILEDDLGTLAEQPFIGRDWVRFYPPECDLENFIERICHNLNWIHPNTVTENERNTLGPVTEDERDFYDNIYRKIFTDRISFAGISSFPLHFLFRFEGAGLIPPPVIIHGGIPSSSGSPEQLGMFLGLQARHRFSDVILRPLGLSWLAYNSSKPCPFLEPELKYLCGNPRKEKCSQKASPKSDCRFADFFQEMFHTSVDNITVIS